MHEPAHDGLTKTQQAEVEAMVEATLASLGGHLLVTYADGGKGDPQRPAVGPMGEQLDHEADARMLARLGGYLLKTYGREE